MLRLLACMPLLVLAACVAGSPDDTPPRVRSVCVKQETFTTLMPIFNGNQMMLLPQIHVQCTQYEQRCVWGKDYQGPKSCEGQSTHG